MKPRLRKGASEYRHSANFSKKASTFSPLKINATTAIKRQKSLVLSGVESSPNTYALFTALLWDCLQHGKIYFSESLTVWIPCLIAYSAPCKNAPGKLRQESNIFQLCHEVEYFLARGMQKISGKRDLIHRVWRSDNAQSTGLDFLGQFLC